MERASGATATGSTMATEAAGRAHGTSEAVPHLTSWPLPRPLRITLDGQEEIKALEGLRAQSCLLCATSPATPSTSGGCVPLTPPKQSRGIFFFPVAPKNPSWAKQAGAAATLSAQDCKAGGGRTPAHGSRVGQRPSESTPLGKHPPQAGSPAPWPKSVPRRKNRGVGGNGFFPEPLPPQQPFKTEGDPQRLSAHLPSYPPEHLHTRGHSPGHRGLTGLGLWVHKQTPRSLCEEKIQTLNQPELPDHAASTNPPALVTAPHPKPRTPRPCPRGAQPHSTPPLWVLTLVTLLLTLLMLQTPLLLLGMVVMRMGVLRSPRVTSTRGARCTQGLPQPDRLSPTHGEWLRPDCLAAAHILPQRWH